ncbi:hypothetical protein KX928_02515 [Roseobacter sp. YSTF-M11]|uniref:Lipoprotein n=1 Tax=Roseobacter insulae TaxID=2859783 RepID=A0A9X1JX59_9RHOB|nr:hypothetical protein [Roseobacter insulae]MBW4706651.1 hypothetical protein [Roseobacter insulae]
MNQAGAYLLVPLLSGALVACGAVEAVQTSKTFELLGLAPDEPCVVTKREGRRLAGSYLRQVSASEGSDVFFVTGKTSRKGLPRNLNFNDQTLRRIRPTEDGPLEGSRRSVAKPIEGLGIKGELPAAYTMSYRAERIDYEGPVVVGPSPTSFEIPTSGRIVYSGDVQLTLATSPGDGATSFKSTKAKFTAIIGYGSQQASLRIDTSAADFPFDGVQWTRLGICGTRVTSSGQGQVLFVQPDGSRQVPFQSSRAVTPIRALLESSQFARTDRPGPPDSFGGTFIVAGDTGTLTGVFIATQPEIEGTPEPL